MLSVGRFYHIGHKSSLLKRVRQGRALRLLPHIFTLGNAAFGFGAIILAIHGDVHVAAYCVIVGALMDALDGRLARALGCTSDFGLQLDSLCDGISFCAAPAIIIYCWRLKKLGILGAAITGCFLLAGLIRLARFNVTHQRQRNFFVGLPTTMAGCFLMVTVLNSKPIEPSIFTKTWVGSLMLLFAVLMVSNVRFPSFKASPLPLPRRLGYVVPIIIFAVLTTLGLHSSALAIFVLYFCFTLWLCVRAMIGF